MPYAPTISKWYFGKFRLPKVLLDSDLAVLYRIDTANLNKAVKRNLDRFPDDFMIQLTDEEATSLRFQIGMSKPSGRGGRRYLPFVFTEQGVAMPHGYIQCNQAVDGTTRREEKTCNRVWAW